MATVYWIHTLPNKARLGTMPRPQGGNALPAEIASLKEQGVDVLLCLLEEKEIEKLQLQEEQKLALEAGIEYHHFPIADFTLPQSADRTNALIAQLQQDLEAGLNIAIHCHGGIGRSTLIAGSVLISLGFTAQQALEMISEKRGVPVPDTEEQKQWLLNRG